MKQSTNRHALNKIWDRMYPQLVGKDYRDDERNRQVSVSVMHKTLFDLMNCEIWNEYLMSTNVRDDDFLFNEKKSPNWRSMSHNTQKGFSWIPSRTFRTTKKCYHFSHSITVRCPRGLRPTQNSRTSHSKIYSQRFKILMKFDFSLHQATSMATNHQ